VHAFARDALVRDERTVREWLAGHPLPRAIRRTLEAYVGGERHPLWKLTDAGPELLPSRKGPPPDFMLDMEAPEGVRITDLMREHPDRILYRFQAPLADGRTAYVYAKQAPSQRDLQRVADLGARGSLEEQRRAGERVASAVDALHEALREAREQGLAIEVSCEPAADTSTSTAGGATPRVRVRVWRPT
jgi:hypothetical protein